MMRPTIFNDKALGGMQMSQDAQEPEGKMIIILVRLLAHKEKRGKMIIILVCLLTHKEKRGKAIIILVRLLTHKEKRLGFCSWAWDFPHCTSSHASLSQLNVPHCDQ